MKTIAESIESTTIQKSPGMSDLGLGDSVIVVGLDGLVTTRASLPVAVTKIIKGQFISLKDRDKVLRSSGGFAIPVPEIVQQTNWTKSNKGTHRLVTFPCKDTIHARDGWVCGYCGSFGDTLDHIYPRSKGGGNTWDNLVTACSGCNSVKGDRTLEEIGWSLRPGNKVGQVYHARVLRREKVVKRLQKDQQIVDEFFASALV